MYIHRLGSRRVRLLSGLLAGVLATGGFVALSGTAEAGPIGSGWTEISPDFKIEGPPGRTRHTETNGEHHFWILKTDPSTYPGRDSGPRSELRFYNDYRTGQTQFEADIKIGAGCSRASVVQIFGAQGRSTAFMAWTVSNSLSHYDGEKFYSPVWDKYLRLNLIHNTSTRKVTVYVNGENRGTFSDHGAAKHYFKAGVYHQRGMSNRCDTYMKNIRIYKK
jgi:hypothetical protein